MSYEDHNLPLRKQADLEILRTNFAFLNSLLTIRSSILPIIASLSATLLVVATFNEKLIPLTEDIKIAIAILLLLIPISLIVSICEITHAIGVTTKEITKIAGGRDPFSSKTAFGKLMSILLAHTPLFLSIVLTIIIGWVICVILLWPRL